MSGLERLCGGALNITFKALGLALSARRKSGPRRQNKIELAHLVASHDPINHLQNGTCIYILLQLIRSCDPSLNLEPTQPSYLVLHKVSVVMRIIIQPEACAIRGLT